MNCKVTINLNFFETRNAHFNILGVFQQQKKVQTGHLQLFNNYIHYLLHLYARSVESLKRWLDQRDNQELGYFRFSHPVHLRFSFMWYFTFLYLLHFTFLPLYPPHFTSVCTLNGIPLKHGWIKEITSSRGTNLHFHWRGILHFVSSAFYIFIHVAFKRKRQR